MQASTRRGGEQGFAVLQMIIVFCIAAAVAGIGLPVYASRAKSVVLEQNLGSLELQVKSVLAADDDARVADDVVLARVARTLDADAAGRYANPLSGSDKVTSQTSLPGGAGSAAPAVWITDDEHYAHAAFAASASTRSRLAGTLVVAFDSHDHETSAVDVYYVDGAGRCSDRVEQLSTAD